MKSKRLLLAVITCLICLPGFSQEIAPVSAPIAPTKALTITLGRGASIVRSATGPALIGSAPTLGIGLQLIRPQGFRHILSLEAELGGQIRNSNGQVIGGRPIMGLGYELRKYFDVGSKRLHPYAGVWSEFAANGGLDFSANGTRAISVGLGLGVSAGVQYDISDRFFIDGGLRLGAFNMAASRFTNSGFTSNATRMEFGLGRQYEGRIGFGVKF